MKSSQEIKEGILQIASDLRECFISTSEAIEQLQELLKGQ